MKTIAVATESSGGSIHSSLLSAENASDLINLYIETFKRDFPEDERIVVLVVDDGTQDWELAMEVECGIYHAAPNLFAEGYQWEVST